MEESVGAEGLEFKWGKKRGVGGKNKDVQFYESFTYDGDEYCLYDCVLIGDASDPDFVEPFVGMIIKIWEHTKRANFPRQVKLLWFFRPSEISSYLEGVQDVLPDELFLASGEGRGVANVNQLEAIGGKCSVLCISKDKRNPQPSAEKIKSANFVFRRAFDVGSCKVLDTIDDKIAGVDVKFIFNREGCEKETTTLRKIEANIDGSSDSLQPTASGSIRELEDHSIKSSDSKENSYGCKQEKEKSHNQLATKKSALAEERSNKDSGVQEGTAHNEHDSCEASGSRGNHYDGKAQDSEVKNTKQKPIPAEERYSNSCEASGSRVNHSNYKKAQVNGSTKQLTKQKSMPAEERYSIESNGLNGRPQKKQKLDGSVIVTDGRNTTILPNISSDGEKGTGSFKRPKDKVTTEDVSPKKHISSDGQNTTILQNTSSDSEKGAGSFKRPRDKVTTEDVPPQKHISADGQNTTILQNISSGGEKGTGSFKRPRDKVTTEDVPPKKHISSDGQNTTILQNISSDGEKGTGSFKRPRDKVTTENAPPEKHTTSDGQNTTILQNISSDGEKGTGSFKRPRDKVTTEDVPTKKHSFVKRQDLGVSVSEGKGLSKKPSFDGKLSKRAEVNGNANERNYEVIEVSQKLDAGKSKWFRNLPWEEKSMREAEKRETLVLLRNLDPTYTSDEVEDIVYSALNERCEARMIERTSVTIPHIGEALVIFKTREVAERAVRSLDEGCLLLSNGRPLVAAFAKITPPGKPSSFFGHIKLLKVQMRREMREAVATSHCSQRNTLEFDMATEWCLHQARHKQANAQIHKRQLEEKRSLQINFKPKLP